MRLSADVVNNYKPIDEEYMNVLLSEEIAKNPKKI